VIEFLKSYAGWLFAGSLLMFFGTLIAMPWIIVRMSADYFVAPDPGVTSWRRQHPVIRWVLRGVKNLLGLIFVLAGIVLSVPLIPGQGLLTLLIGLTLLDFPGKRKVELWLIRRPGIRKAIDWIRERAGREPLVVPPSK
jgi:hypothetical protein